MNIQNLYKEISKAEKNGYADLIKGFNSKPKWSKS